MANEIRLDYGSTGETLYMLVFNSSGSVWNGSAFETIEAYSVGFSSSGVSDGWPTSTDLGDFLTAAGYDYGSADLDLAIGAAVYEFERRTGWKPFIRDAADYTAYYDPPYVGSFGCILSLKYPLLTLTSLSYGLEEDGTGGTAMTQGTDFVMEPYDGGTDEKPWTGVRFLTYPYGLSRSIKVIGKRGYSESCPYDVYQAILRKAAGMVAVNLTAGAPGEAASVKQGPVQFQYSAEAGRGTVDRFNSDFDGVVRRCRRCL
jgi:hypothetical protein